MPWKTVVCGRIKQFVMHATYSAIIKRRKHAGRISVTGGTMNRTNNIDVRQKDACRPSLEKYLGMDEKEKDAEIQKSVDRLQRSIQEILYLLATDKIS